MGEIVERKIFRRAESSQTSTSYYIRQKEQKKHYTGSTIINSRKSNRRKIYKKTTSSGKNGTRLKKDQKNEIADFARHQVGTPTTNAQTKNRYATIV